MNEHLSTDGTVTQVEKEVLEASSISFMEFISPLLISNDTLYPFEKACDLLYEKVTSLLKQNESESKRLLKHFEIGSQKFNSFIFLYICKSLFKGKIQFFFAENGAKNSMIPITASPQDFSNDYTSITKDCNDNLLNIRTDAIMFNNDTDMSDSKRISPNDMTACNEYGKFFGYGSFEILPKFDIFKLSSESHCATLFCDNGGYAEPVGSLPVSNDQYLAIFKYKNNGLIDICCKDRTGNKCALSINSYFCNVVNQFAVHGDLEFRGRRSLFALFLAAHGFETDETSIIFENKLKMPYLQKTFFQNDFKVIYMFMSKKIVFEKSKYDTFLLSLSVDDIVDYYTYPYKLLEKKNSKALRNIQYNEVKFDWEKLNDTILSDEERLCKKIVLAKCSGMSQKEIFKNFIEYSIFKGKSEIAFCDKYLYNETEKLQKKIPNLPSIPRQ